MKTSRQQVLDYIRQQRLVTAGQIAQALQMTEANARHHLAILIDQGLVETTSRQMRRGKGRPAQFFRLSSQASGHNLDRLASALLKEFVLAQPQEVQAELLQRLAERILAEGEEDKAAGEGRSLSSAGLTRRLYQAVQRLSSLKYQARWEAHAEAPHLIFEHCPYATILAQHPELCQVDVALLRTLLGVEVTQLARLASDARGIPHCLFRVGKPR